MRSPLSWVGGKYLLSKELIKFVPYEKTETYVEVFGGGGSLLFAKKRHLKEVYNDINSSLVNFFTVLRDRELCDKLIFSLERTPYSRKEFYNCLWERE